MSETRVCTTCNLEKPLDAYARDRRKPLGRGYRCKECRKAYRTGEVKWPGPPYTDRYATAARARIAKLGLTNIDPWPMPEDMVAGSIATGIAGIELGVSMAVKENLQLAWHSEIDESCSELLERRFPGVPNLGDADLVDWSDVEPVDILISGVPCQPFSYAGNRKGFDDDRDLWPTVAIAIRHLRPEFVFIENVPGFLTGPLERTVRFLAEAGYVGRWVSVRGLDVGAALVRERVFILAALTDRLGSGRQMRAIEPETRGAASWHGSGVGGPRGMVGGVSPFTGERWPGEWGWFEPEIERWEIVHGPVPSPVTKDMLPSPRCVEWLMGFSDGWTEGFARTVRMKMLGNSCLPEQSRFAFDLLRGH